MAFVKTYVPFPPMQRASEIVGNTAKLARLLGVKPPSIHSWLSGAQMVPVARCPTIERLTGGAVRCEEMRPDVDWAYLRSTPKLPTQPNELSRYVSMQSMLPKHFCGAPTWPEGV